MTGSKIKATSNVKYSAALFLTVIISLPIYLLPLSSSVFALSL